MTFKLQGILQRLQIRFQQQGVQLEVFMWTIAVRYGRNYKPYLVSNLLCLDILHAVRRIFQKGTHITLNAYRPLALVFRDSADQGDHRTMATPPAHQLKSQLLAFKSNERISAIMASMFFQQPYVVKYNLSRPD